MFLELQQLLNRFVIHASACDLSISNEDILPSIVQAVIQPFTWTLRRCKFRSIRRLDLKKIHQRVRRFSWFFFQNPVTGVRQHDHGDVVGDQLHLCPELVA
jgi:hypothetical protein